jgi:hypothetical protein
MKRLLAGPVRHHIDPANPPRPREVAIWLRENGVETLNVAGNADPHLEPFVETYLAAVFAWVRG